MRPLKEPMVRGVLSKLGLLFNEEKQTNQLTKRQLGAAGTSPGEDVRHDVSVAVACQST